VTFDKRAEEALPVFPYIVKIEERRIPNNPIEPYCQKMQLLNDGRLGPVGDASGNPIVVQLNEKDTSPSALQSMLQAGPSHVPTSASEYESRNMVDFDDSDGSNQYSDYEVTSKTRSLPWKRADPPGSCHCQWVSK